MVLIDKWICLTLEINNLLSIMEGFKEIISSLEIMDLLITQTTLCLIKWKITSKVKSKNSKLICLVNKSSLTINCNNLETKLKEI